VAVEAGDSVNGTDAPFFDCEHHTVLGANGARRLDPTQWRLLTILCEAGGRRTVPELAACMFGGRQGPEYESSLIRVNIGRIRRKLDEVKSPLKIAQDWHKRGYLLEPRDAAS
jgi:DNA-binding response OmpR family regulator